MRVVLGTANGITSPLHLSASINFLDVTVPAGRQIEHEISPDATAFLLMIRGSGILGETDRSIPAQTAALFEPAGTTIRVRSSGEEVHYILCIR